MKVYIGKYRSWIGTYQIANWLKHFGVSEDRCDQIGKWLGDTWVKDFCQWVYSKKKRKVKVHIHDYDVWSMYSTLAYIILPMLKKLKEQKHGSALVDDGDVPENIRSTILPPVEHEWVIDGFLHDRWDYVLDEMIFAFEFIHPDNENDTESQFDTKMFERSENGFRLFGKYYRGLWD